MIDNAHISSIPESVTHEAADSRVNLHMLYIIEKLDVDRVVVFANDTDILVILLYYWNKYKFDKEL